MKHSSLARRLFCRLFPTILITIAISGFLAYSSARYEIKHNYDAQLISNANVLWVLIQEELHEANSFSRKEVSGQFTDTELKMNDAVDNYAQERMFRVWRGNKIIMASDTAMPESVPPAARGFSDIAYKGSWQIYTLNIAKDNISIEVGERTRLRTQFENGILKDILIPLVFFIPLSGLLLMLGIHNGLWAIRFIVEQIQKKSPDDLTPLPEHLFPSDLAHLGRSMNALLEKLRRSLDAERRFADHAAHQLRTPLAGIRLQLQMLQTADKAEREKLNEELIGTTDKAANLVNKLLASARVSHQPLAVKPFNLHEIIAQVMASFSHFIRSKEITASLEGEENSLIKSDETLVALLFSNVIENAVKYTQAHGIIKTEIKRDGSFWIVNVEDNGVGIPENRRTDVFERFLRIDDINVEGAGLGLSIVAGILERLQGYVELTTPADGKGLRVSIRLPADMA